LPELEVHASPPFAYRNRIRLSLAVIDGQMRAGYIRAQEHGSAADNRLILPITQCPIAAPILWRAAEAVLALVNEKPAPWLRTPNIAPDQLELFADTNESKLQLTLYLRTKLKSLPGGFGVAFTTLCESLRARVPELSGAGVALLPLASSERSRRTETPRAGPSWGSPGMMYAADNQSYWVPRNAFFQVNRFLVPELVQLVMAEADASTGKTLAWDLYAGVGLFARPLASAFAQVMAVEIAEPAFAALGATKLSNLVAIQATTLDFLHAAVIQRERPSLILLDPPRSGAGPEVCGLLARIATPTLIYVSCSPQTMPADLTVLTASGYRVTGLHLFDLFPQTTHTETVAILTR
jgi:23S rRNA (uracil1939-C5)-methyltransferase